MSYQKRELPCKAKRFRLFVTGHHAHLSELRAFLGTAGYYRRFVHNFSMIAAPLFALTKKGVRYKWTKECQQAFDTLKLKLMTEPILALPNDEGLYQLDCDASDTGLGAVLSKVQNGVERVIAYASRTLSKAESSYETTRKELLSYWTIFRDSYRSRGIIMDSSYPRAHATASTLAHILRGIRLRSRSSRREATLKCRRPEPSRRNRRDGRPGQKV